MSDNYCIAIGKVLGDLDLCSFMLPAKGKDKTDYDRARMALYTILGRNGYKVEDGRARKITHR